jgi:hypothetical protein
MDAVTHMCDVEVQEKAKLVAAQTKVREQLRAVNGQDPIHTFQLENPTVFHNEVDATSRSELNTFVNVSFVLTQRSLQTMNRI